MNGPRLKGISVGRQTVQNRSKAGAPGEVRLKAPVLMSRYLPGLGNLARVVDFCNPMSLHASAGNELLSSII